MPGRARASQGAARGGCCVGREPPSLTGPPSLPGRLRARLGFLSPHRAGPCLLTPEGEGGRAAACPAPPSGTRGAGSSPARSTRGAKSPGRADAVAARVERRPGGLPAFTRDDSEADGRRGASGGFAGCPRRRSSAGGPSAPSRAPRPPARRPQAPACPPAPPPSFRRALSVPLGEGKLRPGSADQAAGLRLSMVLSASGNSVQWPDLPQAQPAPFRRL